ncbi:hypothetical protein MBEHAL_0528 [Halarchaeum acidiphilum MH1-52-1]|uniref:Uncharacterized protein n=2 Tax=Halarchaeum acidiphilum TaxID=489138 RepID=U3AAH4_9EURY|nr:hypothetical protein [Halarchaeum acidiphilum]GAD51768.1 hypothetical protein MBEHAL_0528 [Halarchaeum acidiphilum MH1-52-1]
MDRRDYLAALSVAGLAGLTGCSALSDHSGIGDDPPEGCGVPASFAANRGDLPADDDPTDGIPPAVSETPPARDVDPGSFPVATVDGTDVRLAPVDVAHYWWRRGAARFADARGRDAYDRAHVYGAVNSPASGSTDCDPAPYWPGGDRIVCYGGGERHLGPRRPRPSSRTTTTRCTPSTAGFSRGVEAATRSPARASSDPRRPPPPSDVRAAPARGLFAVHGPPSLVSDHPIPKGVSRETLCTVVAGWYAAGASEGATQTSAVEDATGISDAVSRQTAFLADVGVLDVDGRDHRLTERGADLAAALANDRQADARAAFRDLLAEWAPTRRVRALLDGEPMSATDLLPVLAGLAGHDPDRERVRVGLRTLLDLWTWAGVLDRTDRGAYLPGRVEAASQSSVAVGLELTIDVDPDDVENLVRAIQRGLAEDDLSTVEADLDFDE